MADNVRRYGFRWHSPKYGDGPIIKRWPLASAYRPTLTISSAVYVPLRAGDVVKYLSDGTAAIAAGSESDTPDTVVYGVVAGFDFLYDGAKLAPAGFYPSGGVTFGSNLQFKSYVYVYPADTAYFEICADDAATATTYAAHEALVGQNTKHIYSLSGATVPDTGTLLDISEHNTTATFPWRMIAVNERDPNNQDFSGNYVNWIVEANAVQGSAWSATGI